MLLLSVVAASAALSSFKKESERAFRTKVGYRKNILKQITKDLQRCGKP
jgi:hypothetical protein